MKSNLKLSYFLPCFLIVSWAFVNYLNTNKLELVDNFIIVKYYLGTLIITLLISYAILMVKPKFSLAVLASFYLFLITAYLTPGLLEVAFGLIRFRYIYLGTIVAAGIAGFIFCRLFLPGQVFKTLSLVVFFMSIFPAGQLLTHIYSLEPDGSAIGQVSVSSKNRPNIYYIVLDAYSRGDQIENVFGHSNDEFLNTLKKLGFDVSEKSYTGYPWTTYSMSSVFRMDYITEWVPNIGKTWFLGEATAGLRSRGFKLYFVPPHQDKISCPEIFDCRLEASSDTAVVGYLGKNILSMTPIVLEGIKAIAPQLLRTNINEVSDLPAVVSKLPKSDSYLFYAHIEMPHSPYIRHADCRARPEDDKSVLNIEGQKKAYIEFMTCGNRQLINLVKHIQKEDKEAIIVLQSDHGSSFVNRENGGSRKLDFKVSEAWVEAALEERYATLNAWHIPSRCSQPRSRFSANVNTFRLIIACLDDREPVILPEKAFRIDDTAKKIEILRENNTWMLP